jgi:Protein of unknown function (DUF2800)
MSHSVIPPSSAHIWGSPDGCTGWVLMSQQHPKIEESENSKNGTASHEIGSTLINDASIGAGARTFDNFNNKYASNNTLFDEEMFDCAKIYADDVIAVMRDNYIFGGPRLGIEQKIYCPSVHELSNGTPDAWIYNKKTNHLWIWDYKFGYLTVEAFENWQLLNYISGLFDQLSINGVTDQKTIVHMRIAQPRAYHRDGIIREWKVKGSDLRTYFNILESKAHEALGDNPIIRSGPHCVYCTARHSCSAAIEGAVQLYEVAQQSIPADMRLDALGVQLSIVKRAIKQLEYIESGITGRVEELLRKGELLPGWVMESGKGREVWSKPESEVIQLGVLLGHDLKKPDKAITPKQARIKGVDESILKQYSETKQTALKLTRDTGNKARRLFSS